MKALLAFFFLAAATRAAHNDNLRANQFTEVRRFSPYLAMLPRV
jgi:hypothetical protein